MNLSKHPTLHRDVPAKPRRQDRAASDQMNAAARFYGDDWITPESLPRDDKPHVPSVITIPTMTAWLERKAYNRDLTAAWREATRVENEANRLDTAEAHTRSMNAWRPFNTLAKQGW